MRPALIATVFVCATVASCGLRQPIDTTRTACPPATGRVTAGNRPLVPGKQEDNTPLVTVWLTANKYHTAIVIPFDWLVESGFVPPEGFDSSMSVVMSWGNKDAYSEAGMDSYGKIFRVLFTPTPSVMELIVADWNVAEMIPHQRIWMKRVPRELGPRLAHYLNECTNNDDNGRPIVVCPSSWGDGVQLEGSYHYFIPRVCNIWTAQALEAIDCDVNAWRSLSARGLAKQAEKNGFELIWNGYGEQDAYAIED